MLCGAKVITEQDPVVYGCYIGVLSFSLDRKDAEMSLEPRVDAEAASGRVHARHVLHVVDVLECVALSPVVPVTVVEVLPDERVRLHRSEPVNLRT